MATKTPEKTKERMITFNIMGDYIVERRNILESFLGERTLATSYSGPDFVKKQIILDGDPILLRIWAGLGDCYYARGIIFKSFFHHRYQGYLLVCDVTSMSSFTRLTEWLDKYNEWSSPDKPILLVANKCDDKTNRIITTDMLKEFAETHNLEFFECSAKENENVERAVITLVAMIVRNLITKY